MTQPVHMYCSNCDEYHDWYERSCKLCEEPLESYDDYCERRWEQSQQDLLSEPFATSWQRPETLEEYLKQKGRS